MEGDQGLVLDRFHRDRVERRVAGRFEQGLGIGAVGLVAVAIASDVTRMEQGDLVAEARQRAGPILGGATGFDQDLSRGAVGEEQGQGDARHPVALVHRPRRARHRHFENGLCQSTPIGVRFIGLLHRVFVAFGAVGGTGMLVPFGGGVHSITCRRTGAPSSV